MAGDFEIGFGAGRLYRGRSAQDSAIRPTPIPEFREARIIRATLFSYRALSLNIKWTKVSAGMWSGLHSGLIYTIRQSGGAKFYIMRATERSHFASTRSLALAKATAQDDANDMLKAKDRSTPA